MSSAPPHAIIIAGPNGSGKSTVAELLLPPSVTFVNADHIASLAAGIPGTPGDISAGRVLIDWVERLEKQRLDFAFETTLATRMMTTRIVHWRKLGYRVHIFFFWLPSADLAVARVGARVRNGGHDVPEATIRRRFVAGLSNFFSIYRPLVDSWRVYDNSSEEPTLIAKGDSTSEKIARPELWAGIREAYCHER